MKLRSGHVVRSSAPWFSQEVALPSATLAHRAALLLARSGTGRSVKPAAGGKVPEVRSLGTAVSGNGPGNVRVVCRGDKGRTSLRLLSRSIADAKRNGYRVRPSQPKLRISEEQASRLQRQNRALARKCRFKEIQPAVFASGNNDRVVVMPGRYTEPTARRQPLNDPHCAGMTQRDSSGAETPAISTRSPARRPELDSRPGPRAPGRAAARAPAAEPAGHSRCRTVPPLHLQSRAGRLTDGRDHRRASGYKSKHRRRGGQARQARDHPRRPRRWLRAHNLTTVGRLSTASTSRKRRLPDRHGEDVRAADYNKLTFTSDHASTRTATLRRRRRGVVPRRGA